MLINRENPGIDDMNKFLFIEGDLDSSVEEIMKELKWEIPKIEKKPLKDISLKNLK